MISINEISKDFADKKVLKSISCKIPDGLIYGILGPNGSGKSTLSKILTGAYEPDSGKVFLDDSLVVNSKKITQSFLKKIDVVGQNNAIYEEMTAAENLYFFGELYGLKKKSLKDKVKSLMQKLNLDHKKKQKVKYFSGGEKQKLHIAIGLLSKSDIIIFDEPFSGLDVHAKNNIIEIMKDLKSENKSIIISTHDLDGAEKFCDNVLILKDGNIICEGRPSDLIESLNVKDVLDIKLYAKDFQSNFKKLTEVLKNDSNIKFIKNFNNTDLVKLGINEAYNQIINKLYDNDIKIKSFEIKDPTLEDFFTIKTS